MEIQFYLIFSLYGLRYGINTLQVQEISKLPELTPVVTAPPQMIGVVNLRGKIVPVIDLNLQFGRQSNTYQLSDHIIFLEHQNQLLGLIANQVQDVKSIRSDCIDTQFADSFSDRNHPIVEGIAHLEGNLITLLNPEQLLQWSVRALSLPADHSISDSLPSTPYAHFSPEDQQILQERTQNLMQRAEAEDTAESYPIAVMEIRGEYFGIDLTSVREFTTICTVTPIPCCPDYVIGNINLRGEIVTLMSLHSILNVARPNSHQAIVVAVDDITAGIVVDQILDVIDIQSSVMTTLPVAVRSEGQNYTKGTASYHDHTITLLDVPKLLAQGELVVNELI